MIEANAALSTENDAFTAGKKVAEEAISPLSGSKAKVILIGIDIVSRKLLDFGKVQSGIRDVVGPDVPILGVGANGMIVNDRIAFKSVGALALSGDIEVIGPKYWNRSRVEYDRIAENMLDLYAESSKELASKVLLNFLPGWDLPHDVLKKQAMLSGRMARLFSGLINKVMTGQAKELAEEGRGSPATQELIRSLIEKGLPEDIAILGVMSTNLRQTYPQTAVFYNGEFVRDSMAAVMIGSKSKGVKFNVSFGNGAVPAKGTLQINKAALNFLLKVNGKPAIDGYCAAGNFEKEALEELKYHSYANAMCIPGIPGKIKGRDVVHPYVALTDPNVDFVMVTAPDEVVQNARQLQLYELSPKTIIEAGVEAAKWVKTGDGQAGPINDPKFLMMIECGFRFVSLGDLVYKEIAAIREVIGKDVPLFGYGAGGEVIGSQTGVHFNTISNAMLMGGS